MKDLISILLPTRGRPNFMETMIFSAIDLAKDKNNLEFILNMDFDDHDSHKKLAEIHSKFNNVTGIMGTRTPTGIVNLSAMWNECYRLSRGSIAMHAGDDIIFRTQDWDEVVRNKFNEYEDKIIFAYGDDGNPDYRNEDNSRSTFGTHGFLHRNWIHAVGYFVPPYFSSDYNDTWLNEVSRLINRDVYIDILTEHMHPSLGKHDWDTTHQERILRAGNPGEGQVTPTQIYEMTKGERFKDAEKLLKVISNHRNDQ